VIRKASESDLSVLAGLALKLWPDNGRPELEAELTELQRLPGTALFLAEENGRAMGFAQCQLRRDYVEGTDTSPVGYLEGIYVEESSRGRGLAKALLSACADWAREQGCREFASEWELTNTDSLDFHLHMGFAEANRVICFTKKL